MVHSENANKGILITTSTFTRPAKELAQGKQLELIDRESPEQLLANLNTPLSERDKRLKSLLAYLQDNPRNILALKEAGDLYAAPQMGGDVTEETIRATDYHGAIDYYEKVASLRCPTNATKQIELA